MANPIMILIFLIFSGDINFGIQKIKEIKNSFPSFNFCSILTVPSGSNSER